MVRILPALVLAALARRAAGVDPTCSRGSLSKDGGVCCSATCGGCGGADIQCRSLPGGHGECCVEGVLAAARPCSLHEPPCTMAVATASATAAENERPRGGQRQQRQQALASAFGATSTREQQEAAAAERELAKARRRTNVSVLPGPKKDVATRESEYKIKFDGVLLYLPVQSLSWKWVAQNLDSGKDVQLVIEFMDSGANLKKVASGGYDQYLQKFGEDAAKDGRQIYVRLLHEFNGAWYNWCAFYKGNNVKDFKNAYKHAVQVLRSTGANFKFQLAYSARNANGDPTPLKDFYPGDAYVDQVCTSAYNQCGATYSTNHSLEKILGDWYDTVGKFSKKPVCIAEMSSTGHCKGKPDWIKATWQSLATTFTRVQTINWFLENKPYLNRDWDLNTAADRKAFVSGFKYFKKETKRRALAAEAGLDPSLLDDDSVEHKPLSRHEDDELLSSPGHPVLSRPDDAASTAAAAEHAPHAATATAAAAAAQEEVAEQHAGAAAPAAQAAAVPEVWTADPESVPPAQTYT